MTRVSCACTFVHPHPTLPNPTPPVSPTAKAVALRLGLRQIFPERNQRDEATYLGVPAYPNTHLKQIKDSPSQI